MTGSTEELKRQADARVGWILLAILPAALTVYLAFNSGGFFPGATSLAAAEMAVVVAGCLILARHPFGGISIGLGVAVLALGGLTAWTILSANWSDSVARALPEYTRALLYALTLVCFGLLPFESRRIRWMLYGFSAAIVTICVAAMIARTLPHVIFDPALAEKDRLGYPLTYWNSLGLMAGIGVVLTGHLACSTKDPWLARVLGAASVPLVTLTLYYTFFSGASWSAVAAVVVYVLVGRPRGLLTGAIATAPPTFIALTVANPPDALNEGGPMSPSVVAAGHHVAVVLVACMLGSGVLRLCLLPIDRRLDSFKLPGRVRRPVLVGAVTMLAGLAIAGGIAAHAPSFVKAKYTQFTAKTDSSPGGGGSRLLSASTNGRKEHWEVALEEFRRNRLHGGGAGTFALVWAKDRKGTVHVDDAHSLYLETLGELGIVGFVLLIVVLGLILGAFAWRARGPDRAMFAALLAAGIAWALAAGVDWDWEMPAVTVGLFAFGGAALAGRARTTASEGTGSIGRRLLARVAAAVLVLALAVIPIRVAVSAAHYEDALDHFKAGDCRGAKRDAREALSAVGERAAPFVVIGYCAIREQRYGQALRAMEAARKRDPHNWEVFYNLAVAQAGAGRDPRNSARLAALLNPNERVAASAPIRFRIGRRSEWKRVASAAPLLPPAPGDP